MQKLMAFYIGVGHRHSRDVSKTEILTPTSKNGHQRKIINITVTISPISFFNAVAWNSLSDSEFWKLVRLDEAICKVCGPGSP